MNTREQIKEIFADYPSSEELNNFMEELESNVNAHVAQLRRKGISEAEAIKIALDELGDVAALADELNLKNKQEMFSYRYMKTRNFLTPGRTALYVGGSLILVLALKVPMVLALVGWRSDWLTVGLLAVGGLSLLGIVYLGLTQETGARYGMPTKRALGYVGAIALVLPVLAEGLIVAAVFLLRGSSISEWFAELGRNSSAQTAVVISIISGVIGIAWSVWLMVTEKDHKKLWVKQMNDRYAKQWTENYLSHFDQKQKIWRQNISWFGPLSGAIWISALAGFVWMLIMHLAIFSWLVIVAAIVLQLLLTAGMGIVGKKNH